MDKHLKASMKLTTKPSAQFSALHRVRMGSCIRFISWDDRYASERLDVTATTKKGDPVLVDIKDILCDPSRNIWTAATSFF